MPSLAHKGAVFAASAALAFTGVAVPAVASGHHKAWSTAKCDKKAARWKKAHRHPTAKQTKRENKNLAKHGCKNTV